MGKLPDVGRSFNIVGLGATRSPSLGTIDVLIALPGDDGEPVRAAFAVVAESAMRFCAILGVSALVKSSLQLNFASLSGDRGNRAIVRFHPPGERGVFGGVIATEPEGLNEITALTQQVCIGTVEEHLRFAVKFDDDGNLAGLSSLIAPDQVIKLQSRNSQLRALKRVVSSNHPWPKQLSQFRRYRESLQVLQDIVLYRGEAGIPRYVITFQFLVEVVLVLHYKMAHLGREKLIDQVRQHVWHPSLAKVARDVAVTCEYCQKYKVSAIVTPPILKIETAQPFELVALDLLAMTICEGFVGLLVVMDHYSKWLAAASIRSKTSAHVAGTLELRILSHLPRCPLVILSDNGPEFSGRPFNDVLEKFGIKHQYTTPNKPSSNGLVERANRTVTELLRLQVATTRETWLGALPRAVMIHNTTCHSSLKQSPANFLLGTSHHMTNEPILPLEVGDTWKEGNPSFVSFSRGQLVLKKAIRQRRLVRNKLEPQFIGPYSVQKVNQNGITYMVRDCGTGRELKAHHGQLRAFYQPPSYLLEHPYFAEVKRGDSRVAEKSSETPPETSKGAEFWVSGSTAEESSITDNDSSVSLDVSRTDYREGAAMEKTPLWDVSRLVRSGIPEESRTVFIERELEQPVLPISTTLSTGEVVDHDSQFWGIDEEPLLEERTEDTRKDPVQEFLEENLVDLVEKSCEALQEDLQMLSGLLEMSVSSFSGFSRDSLDPDAQEQPLSQRYMEHSEMVVEQLQEAESRLASLRESVAARQKTARESKVSEFRGLEEVNLPRRTRSMGPVGELPHVQPRVLEYKRREATSGEYSGECASICP